MNINESKYQQLSYELKELAANKTISLNWGMRQNDKLDNLLGNAFFKIITYQELCDTVNDKIIRFKQYFWVKEHNQLRKRNVKYEMAMQSIISIGGDIKSEIQYEDAAKIIFQYYKCRWFIRMCSLCDEYIFCQNKKARRNPNDKDRNFDITIVTPKKEIQFDLKDTRIPRKLINNHQVQDLIDNPKTIIDFYYNNQSEGQRNWIQNRLFIVNHSLITSEREAIVRTSWKAKEEAFNEFLNRVSEDSFVFLNNNRNYATIIFILETENGIEWKIIN